MKNLFWEASWLEGPATHGYGAMPIPHELDVKISVLLREWCGLSEEQRAAESSDISDQQRATLLSYSERMASRAVREKDSAVICEGLVALGVDGWRTDWRDNTMVLSLHNRSAELLGVEPSAVFSEAARYLTPNVRKSFEQFLKREKNDRSIDAMGFTESEDADGFRYKRTW